MPVAEPEKRDLLALEELLDDDRAAEALRALPGGIRLLLRAADEDAFAGREPVGLDDARRLGLFEGRGIGDAGGTRISLAKDFEPSIRAAASLGPNTATPARRSSSATPATSGASGPITTRSISCCEAEPEQPFDVVGADRVAAAERRDPGVSRRGVELVATGFARSSRRARARVRPSRRSGPSRGRV